SVSCATLSRLHQIGQRLELVDEAIEKVKKKKSARTGSKKGRPQVIRKRGPEVAVSLGSKARKRVSAKSSRQSGKTVSLLDPSFYYQYQKGHPVLNIRLDPNAPTDGSKGRETRTLRREDLSPSQSVLSQKKDSDIY